MKVLLPFQLPEPEAFSTDFVSFLDQGEVILLGCYLVPEQTSPEQAHATFEAEAKETMDQLNSRLESEVVVAERELVFTPDVLETIGRIADKYDVDTVVTPRDIGSAQSLLVFLTQHSGFQALKYAIGHIVDEDITRVSLVRIGEPNEEADLAIEGFEKQLAELQISEEVMSTQTISETDKEALEALVEDHDAILIGERGLRLRRAVLGPVSERLLTEQSKPVFVVRLQSENTDTVSD